MKKTMGILALISSVLLLGAATLGTGQPGTFSKLIIGGGFSNTLDGLGLTADADGNVNSNGRITSGGVSPSYLLAPFQIIDASANTMGSVSDNGTTGSLTMTGTNGAKLGGLVGTLSISGSDIVLQMGDTNTGQIVGQVFTPADSSLGFMFAEDVDGSVYFVNDNAGKVIDINTYGAVNVGGGAGDTDGGSTFDKIGNGHLDGDLTLEGFLESTSGSLKIRDTATFDVYNNSANSELNFGNSGAFVVNIATDGRIAAGTNMTANAFNASGGFGFGGCNIGGSGGDNGQFDGFVQVGEGFKVKEGSNKNMGVATLAAGTVTVSNTLVASDSRIFLTRQTLSGVATAVGVGVTARVNATSFTITSESASDTSDIAWQIIQPY